MSALKEKSPVRRDRIVLIVLFVVYLVMLSWIVLWKLDTPYIGAAAGLARPIKLVPFVASGDAGASKPAEVFANILLFVPFGIYLGLLAPKWGLWAATGVFAGASLIFETTQHLISVGSFDTSDIISNAAGGLAGLGVLALARRKFKERTAAVVTRVCLIGAIPLLLASGIFVASPLHYEQPRDVVFPRTGTSHSP